MLNSAPAPLEISIRLANEGDISKIVPLVESVYRGENSKKGWTTEAHLLDGQRTDAEMVREQMATGVFLLAFRGEHLLSSVYLEKQNGYAYIGMLSVDVNAQNLKLGRRMLEECEKYASREWNIWETRITVVRVRTELVSWYDRRGYVPTGNFVPFHTDPRFGIPKVDDLSLIEMAKPIARF